MSQQLLRQLPKVSLLLEQPSLQHLQQDYAQEWITEAIRETLDAARQQILHHGGSVPRLDELLSTIVHHVQQKARPKFRTVINGTGIVLHTNLGRSPMPEVAAEAAYEAARGYLNLELDLATGLRSSRQNPVREGICRITGAEAATVVNNCAANLDQLAA